MLAELNYDNMPNAAGLMEWLKPRTMTRAARTP